MTEVQNMSAHRPITPPRSKPSSSHFLTTSTQNITIQNPSARFNGPVGPLSPVNQNGSYAFDRVIKSGQVQRRAKKKGGWRSSWKPAYLVLRPNLLSVYKDQDETELRASITLSDVTAVAPVKKSNHDHVFGVFSPSKNYHFAGLSAREAADWITIIRLEARTESAEEIHPPSTSLKQNEPHIGYETTDLSADDDLDVPGSPEVPHWSVRGNKTRADSQLKTEPRTISGLTGYSGNESFATSQSDFSDTGFGSSVPGTKGYLSSSIPAQPSALSPIPDNAVATSQPKYPRGPSNLSDLNLGNGQMSLNATPKAVPRSIPTAASTQLSPVADPSRIIRQGHLKLAKTISGVKQWKTVWVVLRNQSLSFYKSSSDSSPANTVAITSIIEAAEIDRKKKQNCFQIIGEEKTWKLQTETEDDLESWLGGLKSVLVKQEAERERERGSRNASFSQQDPPPIIGVTHTSPPQSPTSRDGEHMGMVSGITMGMKGVSLEKGGSGSSGGTRRVVSPELTRA